MPLLKRILMLTILISMVAHAKPSCRSTAGSDLPAILEAAKNGSLNPSFIEVDGLNFKLPDQWSGYISWVKDSTGKNRVSFDIGYGSLILASNFTLSERRIIRNSEPTLTRGLLRRIYSESGRLPEELVARRGDLVASHMRARGIPTNIITIGSGDDFFFSKRVSVVISVNVDLTRLSARETRFVVGQITRVLLAPI